MYLGNLDNIVPILVKAIYGNLYCTVTGIMLESA